LNLLAIRIKINMKIYLYLGLLNRLLTDIKPLIESDKVISQSVCLNKITFDIEKLNSIESATAKYLSVLYNGLYDKIKHYFDDMDSEIRKPYVMRIFTEIKSKLLELIALEESGELKL